MLMSCSHFMRALLWLNGVWLFALFVHHQTVLNYTVSFCDKILQVCHFQAKPTQK